VAVPAKNFGALRDDRHDRCAVRAERADEACAPVQLIKLAALIIQLVEFLVQVLLFDRLQPGQRSGFGIIAYAREAVAKSRFCIH